MADTDNIVTKLQQGNQLMGQLVNIVNGWMPRAFGAFTMSAAASKSVTDANCSSASYVVLIPINAAAGTLQGSAKCLYVTAANGAFTVSTASAASAAGTESFLYLIFTAI